MKSGKLRLFWCKGMGIGNIGDVLSPWMLRVNGKPFGRAGADHKRKLLMVGSIMSLAMPGDTVWGTGTNYSPLPLGLKCNGPWKIHAVRGPLTREAIRNAGYDCPEIYGDGGLVMPRLYSPTIAKAHKLGIVPHQVDMKFAKEHYPDKGVTVSPYRRDTQVPSFIDEMLACERIVSSSLHGLILAHAYGIPARWVKMTDGLYGRPKDIKFRDYFASVGIKPYDPVWPQEKDWDTKVDLQIDLEPLWATRPWKKTA